MANSTLDPKQQDENKLINKGQADELENWPVLEKEPTYDAPGNAPSSIKESGKSDIDPEDLAEKEAEANPFNYASSGQKVTKNSHSEGLGRGYVQSQGGLAGMRKKRRLLAVGSIFATILIAGIVSLFSFLNVFKLDHLMQNIDAKTFARLNGNLDNRSTKYINAYMTLRLADIGDDPDLDRPNDPDNLILRANRVDNNNPTIDWYKTMRASKFEQEVFEKYGFKFTSVAKRQGNKIVFRPGFIQNKDVSTKELINLKPAEMENILKGNINELNGKLSKYVEVEAFANDKEGRRAIKRVVNDNTRFYEVFKRRMVRKAIQNMTGVRDWRFFENKRNKLDEKTIDIRNKLISKAIPESTKSGKFVYCLFGISNCVYNRDPSAPSNQAGNSLVGDNDIRQGSEVERADENGPLPPERIDLTPATDTVKKITANILTKANAVLGPLNIISTLDSFSSINKAISNKQISKGIAVARGVQAMGLYQVFGTARDQVKAGDIQAAELNKFMPLVAAAASSEAYTKVIDDKGESGKITTSQASKAYCDQSHRTAMQKNPEKAEKEYAYLCADKQIGGGTRAADIEESYNSSIGGTIKPILAAYDGVRGAPIIGKVIDLAQSVLSTVSEAVVGAILKATGLQGPIDELMANITGRLVAYLGAGPIMNGSESSGEIMNWAMQGAAYSSEATSRSLGGSITTSTSAKLSRESLAVYQIDTAANHSLAERYLSTGSLDSITSRSLVAVSNIDSTSMASFVTSLPRTFKSFASTISMPFSGKANAAGQDGYRAADFAGIQTYDFPATCYDNDPISTDPASGTNIIQIVGGIPPSELTWDLVTDADAWYKYVYEKIGEDTENGDLVAEKIYNCHLLDTAVRGSLGHVYGYKNDNGLDEGSANSGDSGTSSSAASLTSLNNHPLSAIQSKWINYIKDSVKVNLPGNSSEQGALAARVTWWSLKEGILNLDNPLAYSNCNFATGDRKIGVLDTCPVGRAWQVGISSVQVPNFSLSEVETAAKQRHPGKSIRDILEDTARLIGIQEGSSEYNTAVSSTGELRKSILLRDPATGFVFVDRNISSECIKSWRDWCGGSWDPAKYVASSPDVAKSVITELTSYFTSSSTGSVPVSGNTPELAKKILNEPKITYTTSFAKEAVVAASKGEASAIEARCGGGAAVLDPRLLGAILQLSQKHTVGIGYFTNGCHSSGSKHYLGKAVDINSIDGRGSTGGDADRPVMQEITGYLPDGSGMGEVNCSSIPIKPINNVSLFSDECNHIHFQVP